MALTTSAATNELTTLLQKGLFEEEANHNLDAAKQAYESVITQFDKDRKLAATAIFRLGEVLRKQGKTNEANAQYERVVREFPDQEKLVSLSRQFGSLSTWVPSAQPDPQKVLDEAKADVVAGKYADALAKNIWYFEHATKYNPSLSGVRLSSGLREWSALGAVYPPALAKLKATRDEIEKNFREGEAWRDPFPPFMDFSSINRELEEDERTKDLFLWLHENRPSAAKRAYFAARSTLIQAKEYEVLGNYIGLSSFETILRSYQLSKGYAGRSGFMTEHSENHFRGEAATLVALLVLNKRDSEAEQIIQKALKEVEDPEFKQLLDQARKGELPPTRIAIPNRVSPSLELRTIPTRTLREPIKQSEQAVIVLDNSDAELTGDWTEAKSTDSFGGDGLWANSSDTTNATSTATYRPIILELGNYYLEVWYSAGNKRSPATLWEVVTSSGVRRFSVDQTRNGGRWVRVDNYPFTFYQGSNSYVRLLNSTGKKDEIVIADAVRFVPVKADLPPPQQSSFDVSSLTSLRAETEAELLKYEPLLSRLLELPKEELPGALSTALPSPDTNLLALLQAKSKADQKLAEARNRYAGEHPEVRLATALAKELDEQLAEKASGLLRGLEIRVSAAKMRLEQLGNIDGASRSVNPPSATTSAEAEEIRRIQALIKNSPDLINAANVWLGDRENREIGTLLHEAARKGQVSVARFLIENSANVNSRTMSLDTPLHIAAANGHKAVAELLLENGADLGAEKKSGETALHDASFQGHLLLVKFLVENGADINGRTESGSTPLFRAANMGHKPIVEYLVSKGADVNARTSSGATALNLAMHRQDVAEFLIRNGADVNATERNGEPPIWEAVKRKMPAVVDVLLERGADVRVRGDLDANRTDWSLLHVAVNHGDVDTIKVLLKHDADVNLKVGRSEQAPLHFVISAAANRNEMIKLLIDAEADVNVRKSNGRTPLHLAGMHRESAEIAIALIEAGADVNVQDFGGYTPLHYAAHGNQKVAKLLLESGANPNVVTTSGDTPLSRAQKTTVPDLVELLKQYGANENLARLSRISVARPSSRYETTVFITNNFDNQFTLLEAIAEAYFPSEWRRINSADVLSFPDFSNLVVRRIENGKETTISVDLEAALENGDCSKDVVLKWGDIIEVPERNHKLAETWLWPSHWRDNLMICSQRKIEIEVKGVKTPIVVKSPFYVIGRGTDKPAIKSDVHGPVVGQKWTTLAIADSRLLLSSSDPSRIKVKRLNVKTGKVTEFTVNSATNAPPNDLWLREGDVIEIPERDPSLAPQASSHDSQPAPVRAIQTRTLRVPPVQSAPVTPTPVAP